MITRDDLHSRSIKLKEEVECKMHYWWSILMVNTMDKYGQIFPYKLRIIVCLPPQESFS